MTSSTQVTANVPLGADVAELRDAAASCHGCELWEPATQTVFSAGDPHARLMLVGEQPGDVEDRRGVPFVGPAGTLLQRALGDAGIELGSVYVTNAVKHFRFKPQGKRRLHQTPEARHISACRPWLQAEVMAVDPSLVVLLGATAGKAVLGPGFRVTAERGRLIERDTAAGPRRLFATLHPSALLRLPDEDKQQGYDDFVSDLRAAAALV